MLTLTFKQFIDYGLKNTENIINGYPWLFELLNIPVSHERDDLYLLNLSNGITLHFHEYETICIDMANTPKNIIIHSFNNSKIYYL